MGRMRSRAHPKSPGLLPCPSPTSIRFRVWRHPRLGLPPYRTARLHDRTPARLHACTHRPDLCAVRTETYRTPSTVHRPPSSVLGVEMLSSQAQRISSKAVPLDFPSTLLMGHVRVHCSSRMNRRALDHQRGPLTRPVRLEQASSSRSTMAGLESSPPGFLIR